MSSFKKPTPGQIDKAIPLLVTPQHCRMFFGKLENPEWVAPLREKGFFRSPPKPMERDGGTAHPFWPASEYLARMAPLIPEEVFEALRLIETENARVISDIVQAALGMPGGRAAELSKKIVGAIKEDVWASLYVGKAAELAIKLAGDGESAAALSLADALFYVTSEKSISWQPVPRIEPYRYQELLPGMVNALVNADASTATDWACGLLKRMAEYHLSPDDRADFQDLSYIWRAAIEDHPQNRGHGITDAIVSSARDALERVVREGRWPLRKVAEYLDGYGKLIFARLRLHIIRLFAESCLPLARNAMLNRECFDSLGHRHEYSLLLRDRFKLLEPGDQSVILAWIDAGPEREDTGRMLRAALGRQVTDEDVNRRVQAWQRDRLSWFHESLPQEWLSRYRRLVAQVGEPQHPDMSHWVEFGWGGAEPPKKAQELAAMGTTELMEFLRFWRPDSEDPFGPSLDDQARAFGAAVNTSPARFAEMAPAFADLHPTYVCQLLEELRKAVSGEKLAHFEEPLDLCLAVVAKPLELEEGHRIGGDAFESHQSWEYTRATAGDLAKEMCDKDAPLQLRNKLWACIGPLLDDQDKNYIVHDEEQERDVRLTDGTTDSLNNPRARAMHAAISYALWVKRQVLEAADGDETVFSGMDEILEARVVFEEHLRPTCPDSEAVRAAYGMYFGQLCWLDQDWAARNARGIFTLEGSKSRQGWAAWNAYLLASRVFDGVFGILQAEYSHVVDQLSPDLEGRRGPHDPLARLAEHLVVLCGRGRIRIQDGDGLLKRFFANSPSYLFGWAIETVGRSLKGADELPGGLTQRFVDLWQWCWSEFGARQPSEQRERFGGFGWWCVCGAFEDSWCLDQLAKVVEVAPLVEPEQEILGFLAGLVVSRPSESIMCVDRMVRGDVEGWRVYGRRDELKEILGKVLSSDDVEAQKVARGLVNHLGRRGYMEYGELL